MSKITAICDTINVNQNIATIRFIVVDPNMKPENGKIAAKAAITAQFNDKAQAKNFNTLATYEISFDELPAAKAKGK